MRLTEQTARRIVLRAAVISLPILLVVTAGAGYVFKRWGPRVRITSNAIDVGYDMRDVIPAGALPKLTPIADDLNFLESSPAPKALATGDNAVAPASLEKTSGAKKKPAPQE